MAVPRISAKGDDRNPPRHINRAPSSLLMVAVPWLSIMLASMATYLPVIASAPVMPPLGYMMLVTWRILRPGLLPVWAGLPLGAFDDLYSGQPVGSGVVLWSLTMLAMEIIDERYLWRGFVQDWMAAAGLFSAYLLMGALLAAVAAGHLALVVVAPQAVLTIALYPTVAGLVTLLDRLRLMRFRTI